MSQDRAAVIIAALLDILDIRVQRLSPSKREELESYLRDEIVDIERRAAADRPTAD
jgi:hypothetical protein